MKHEEEGMFARMNNKFILFSLFIVVGVLVPESWISMDVARNLEGANRYDEIVTGDMTAFNWTTTLNFPEQLSSQSINIGMIFTDIKSRFIELKVALDSLMLHRSCHVNFNFGVDDESKEWVEAYFKLRNFPATDIQFYSLEMSDELVKRVTESSIFRGGVAFFKINADQLFPTVDDMFLLDFDILVQKDICVAYSDVHNQLKEEKKMIMVAGEMGPWYDRNYGTQPIIGFDLPVEYKAFWTGINTGVMFLDLHQMREKKWTETWLTELQSGRYSADDYLALGEQSLMNAIAQIKPDIFGFMPYTFNFQINYDKNAHPQIDLQVALFEYVLIFHGSNRKYQQSYIQSLAHVAWLLHNPMHAGTIPSYIESGEITIENYKKKKSEIWWHLHNS
jgi:lipopolysaccharide biosynthesis glycosyltransferase